MPLNLGFLALPLLGGYLFLSTANACRFKTARYSGYRLFFASAVAGAVLMAASYAFVCLLKTWTPWMEASWRRYFPFQHSGTAIGAFLLGYFGAYTVNWGAHLGRWMWWDVFENDDKPLSGFVAWKDSFRYRRDSDHRGLLKEAEDVIEDDGDSFEMLLARAMHEKKQVMITLNSGKVYTGYVLANFNPAKERKYVSLLKVVSGYREDGTREFVPTTIYEEVGPLAIEGYDSIKEEDFSVVLPVSDVAAINVFDLDVYSLFENPEERDKLRASLMEREFQKDEKEADSDE